MATLFQPNVPEKTLRIKGTRTNQVCRLMSFIWGT